MTRNAPQPQLGVTAPPSELVSPRTQSLAVYVLRAVEQLRRRGHTNSSQESDGLLFLGNWHDAHPRRLFHDDVLEPVDKVVWAVIRHHADFDGATAFPSYKSIANSANVRGKSTIARSIMLLRITRWLSLCAKVRDSRGRFQGNVYALHDEPITVEDALHLDPSYLTFLLRMTEHIHARVRRVASHFSAVVHVPTEHPSTDSAARIATDGPRSRVRNSNSVAQVRNSNPDSDSRVRNSNTVETDEKNQLVALQVRNSNLDSSSCSLINTTTTIANSPEKSASTDPAPELVYPRALSEDEKGRSARYLSSVPVAARQDVLDELQGRLTIKDGSAPPVNNPLGYLKQLCRAAESGAFELTSLGLRVRRGRKQHQAREQALAEQQSALPPPADEGSAENCVLAKRVLAMRDRHSRRSGLDSAADSATTGASSKEPSS